MGSGRIGWEGSVRNSPRELVGGDESVVNGTSGTVTGCDDGDRFSRTGVRDANPRVRAVDIDGITDATPRTEFGTNRILVAGALERWDAGQLATLYPDLEPNEAVATLALLNALRIMRERHPGQGPRRSATDTGEVLELARQIARDPKRFQLRMPGQDNLVAFAHVFGGRPMPEATLRTLARGMASEYHAAGHTLLAGDPQNLREHLETHHEEAVVDAVAVGIAEERLRAFQSRMLEVRATHASQAGWQSLLVETGAVLRGEPLAATTPSPEPVTLPGRPQAGHKPTVMPATPSGPVPLPPADSVGARLRSNTAPVVVPNARRVDEPPGPALSFLDVAEFQSMLAGDPASAGRMQELLKSDGTLTRAERKRVLRIMKAELAAMTPMTERAYSKALDGLDKQSAKASRRARTDFETSAQKGLLARSQYFNPETAAQTAASNAKRYAAMIREERNTINREDANKVSSPDASGGRVVTRRSNRGPTRQA